MKLVIEKIRIRNFLSFGRTWQEIELKPGINLILGNNIEKGFSNGSGKSSALEAIPFAFFGQTHKEIKKEQLINWKNKKNCEVQLTFKKGSDVYRIERGIKPDKFEIYKNDILIERPSHVKDYQKQLEEIIELNFQTFISLVHSNINSSVPVLSMSKPEKRKFIEKVFGLTLYTQINDKCNEKLKIISQRQREIELSREHNFASIDSAKKRIALLTQKISNFRISEVELKDAKIKLEETQEGNEDIDEKFNALEKNIKNIEFRCIYYDKLNGRIDNSIKKILYKNKMIEDNIWKICDSIKKYEVKLKLLKQTEELYGTIDRVRTSLKEFIDKALHSEKEVNEIKEFLHNVDKEIVEAKVNVKHICKSIEGIEGRGECPTCGQPVGHVEHDLKKDKEDKVSKLTVLEGKYKALKEKLNSSKNKHEEIVKIKNSWEKGLKEMELLTATTSDEGMNALTESKESLEKQSERYSKVLNNLKLLEEKQEIENTKFNKGLSLLNEKKEVLKGKIIEIKEAERLVDKLIEKLEFERKNKRDLEEIVTNEEESIKKLETDSKLKDEEEKKLKNLSDYINCSKEVCKDENIKQHAISRLLPFLNNKMNHYLSNLGHDFYVVLNNWLDPTIKGPGITKGTYNSLSGGEKRGIDLSLQFAFLDIARVRAGIWPDIWISDELLDSSIDRQGLNELMRIIKSKHSEEPDSKICIISHRSEIGEDFEPDNIITIEKEGGFSKVKNK